MIINFISYIDINTHINKSQSIILLQKSAF